MAAVVLCAACDDAPDAPDAATDAPVADVDVGARDATPLDATQPDAMTVDAVGAADAPDVLDATPPDAPPADVVTRDTAIAPDAPASAGCASLALCDGFEDAAPGGPPSASRWAVVSPNCSGSGRLAVDGAVAHGGARSVRVDGGGGYCDHVFLRNASALAALGGTVYGRFFVRLGAALGDGHVTFLAMRDGADGDRDLRMGGQSRIFMWNRESDDATLPELSPTGVAASQRPDASRWYCVEFAVDGAAGTLQTWVDGAPVSGLAVDAAPTADVDARWLSRGAWRPRLTDLRLGWESYAGQTMTLWFDDVALDARRVGCTP